MAEVKICISQVINGQADNRIYQILSKTNKFINSEDISKLEAKLFDTVREAHEHASYNLPNQIWDYEYNEIEV